MHGNKAFEGISEEYNQNENIQISTHKSKLTAEDTYVLNVSVIVGLKSSKHVNARH